MEALILTGHLGEQFNGFRHEGMALTFHQELEPLGTGGALWNARHLLQDRFILLWGDDFHPINYASIVAHHEQMSSPLTLTVTNEHSEMNLLHIDGIISQYDKSGTPPSEFNGYESGTSVVEKSVLLKHGKEGKWSWEETVYPKMTMKATAYVDNTKFWDMGTPERLERLEEFLNKTSL